MMAKRELAVLSSQGQLRDTQEAVKAQTPSPPSPVGHTRKGSALYQLLVLTSVTDGTQGLNLSVLVQHQGVGLTCLAGILNKAF